MRKKLFAAAFILAASPVLALAQIGGGGGQPIDHDLKEYDVHFDGNGKVVCEGAGTKCTAPG